MKKTEISGEVVNFVGKHIRSIEQLEILLLLREQATHSWSVTEVNAVIRSSEDSVSTKLRQLASVGFLSVVPGSMESFRFGPNDPQIEETISKLAGAYRDRRATIIELIYCKPAQAIRSFSEAFCVKKPEKKDG